MLASKKRGLRLAVALGCVVVIATACSSESSGPTGSPSPSAPATSVEQPSPSPSESTGGGATELDLSGTWSGTWTNTTPNNANGSFTIEWVQSGSDLAGTISIAGTPCLDGGDITGEIHGDAIEFGAVNGQVAVQYEGTLHGDSMSGTYTTKCGDAEGTWKASKKA
ncbi:MAG TPA: hypothetical protein VH989_09245 [Actinomycetota bacterium]